MEKAYAAWRTFQDRYLGYAAALLFVGATLLALGYQIFMSWVDANPDLEPVAVPLSAEPVALEQTRG